MPDRYHHAIRKYLVAKSLDRSLDKIVASPNAKNANLRLEAALAEAKLPNVTFIEPAPAFTHEDGAMKVFEGKRILYYDDNHLNVAGTQVGFETLLREPLDRFFVEPVVAQP